MFLHSPSFHSKAAPAASETNVSGKRGGGFEVFSKGQYQSGRVNPLFPDPKVVLEFSWDKFFLEVFAIKFLQKCCQLELEPLQKITPLGES